MVGLNRLVNLILNFVSFAAFSYGLYSIINSIATWACFVTPPVGFFAVLCLLMPVFKFLFVRLNVKEGRLIPEALIRVNLHADGRIIHREDKGADSI